MNTTLHRVRSIDAFRAVTMFLMIFVNDIDGMPNTPQWIQHAHESADALGLADTIFPAFLFIVGLSIPFAFQNRLRQGYYRIPWRIVTRSAAMIFIGVFFTNVETSARYFSDHIEVHKGNAFIKYGTHDQEKATGYDNDGQQHQHPEKVFF